VIARMQNKTIEGVERVLFEKDFNYELSPFVALTPDNKKGWIKSNHFETQFALVSGSRMMSWMFTPRFDLANVRNPSFNVRQAISNRGYSFDDSIFFMVSEDYAGGDPLQATWDMP